VRLDDQAEIALALIRSEGRTDSEAVRLALCEVAERRRSAVALRAEVAALAEDKADREEAMAVLAEMEAIAPEADV
jgi:hypothetical protein